MIFCLFLNFSLVFLLFHSFFDAIKNRSYRFAANVLHFLALFWWRYINIYRRENVIHLTLTTHVHIYLHV